ncbi:methionyl-tRNA formyltransferase [Nonlabens xiamenensis]|uniref:methionyl-tRNA formyltransferase n=1 Tax=Nonlabens xiamenensis TaxID=2341043 RepID=UPI000F611D64|nr:formyltransferase family protein [Nonlabens xiamenensis]
MNIALLCSGNLGYEMLKYLHQGSYHLSCVLTDSKSKNIIEYTQENSIALFVGNPRGGKAYAEVSHLNVEVLLSVNYLFLIEEDLIQWPTNIAVNVHGSLLPRYRGRTPHVWAIINGETQAGITLHEIELGCDTGDVIEQIVVDITPEMTGAKLLSIYEGLYPKLVNTFLINYQDSQLVKRTQNEKQATYFGKRTPEMGKINWNWSKDRICNWVRAQSEPYPGAYACFMDHKIIIDKVKKSDMGFHYEMPNGYVLSTDPLTIKCPDGALEIIKTRHKIRAEFLLNKKLES